MRADDGTSATAWTPASGRYDGLTVAVLGRREPRRTAAVRDAIVTALHEGPWPPTSGVPRSRA